MTILSEYSIALWKVNEDEPEERRTKCLLMCKKSGFKVGLTQYIYTSSLEIKDRENFQCIFCVHLCLFI